MSRAIKYLYLYSLMGVILSLSAKPLNGQIYLQLEKSTSSWVKKFSVGEQIKFKTADFTDAWQQATMLRILPEVQSIMFEDRIIQLDEITHFQYDRPAAKAIGNLTYRFGIAWLVFAGIIEGTNALGILNTPYDFGVDTAVIGGGAILGGLFTKSVLGTVKIPINGRNRLRILDLRF